MPVALCVLGILSVCQAIHSKPSTPNKPNDQRSSDKQQPVDCRRRAVRCFGEQTGADDDHLRRRSRSRRRSAVVAVARSSMPGALRYQWPRSIAANTTPRTSPDVTMLNANATAEMHRAVGRDRAKRCRASAQTQRLPASQCDADALGFVQPSRGTDEAQSAAANAGAHCGRHECTVQAPMRRASRGRASRTDDCGKSR